MTDADAIAGAVRRAAAGAAEDAAWTVHDVARRALARGDDAGARDLAVAALAWLDGAPASRAAGWLRLLLAEVERAAGRHEASARWSVLAERAFAAAGDDAGGRAVRFTRALRALLAGDGAAGEALAAALAPELDAAGEPLAAAWLRIAWAQRRLDAGAAVDALELATRAVEGAPPDTPDHLVAAALAARALAAMGRPSDAATVAAAALARAPEDGPPAVRAMAYRELGAALAAGGHDALAHVCLDVAAGLAGAPDLLRAVVADRLAGEPPPAG